MLYGCCRCYADLAVVTLLLPMVSKIDTNIEMEWFGTNQTNMHVILQFSAPYSSRELCVGRYGTPITELTVCVFVCMSTKPHHIQHQQHQQHHQSTHIRIRSVRASRVKWPDHKHIQQRIRISITGFQPD